MGDIMGSITETEERKSGQAGAQSLAPAMAKEQTDVIPENVQAGFKVIAFQLQDMLNDLLSYIQAKGLTGSFNRSTLSQARLEALKEFLEDYSDDLNDGSKESTGLEADAKEDTPGEKKKRRKDFYPEGRRKSCKLTKKKPLAGTFNFVAANENSAPAADVADRIELAIEIIGALQKLRGQGLKVSEVYRGASVSPVLAA